MTESNSEKNKRIVKNTLMLYFRMFLIMIVTLYTSRVVLQALGVDDFGIYNVVGGLVSAFSLLTSSLSSVGARFINIHLGRNDIEKVKDVVSNTVNIQIYLSIIILIVCETIGLWFFENKLNIPQGRYQAAFWVYQFSVMTFIVKLISVPYNSLIVAHEKMSAYAYISILEVLMQLGLVYCLLTTENNRLILYAALMFLLSLIVTLSYMIYCYRKFDECCYRIKLKVKLFKEMASYAGWNFIGLASGVFKNQGIDIIINIFFGVALNAARGIATQINNAVTKFSQNFMTALNPQITQSYAEEDWSRFHFLIIQGARFSYYLMLLICLPIFLEMDYILKLWLTIVPPDTATFARLQILLSLIAILSNTNITAMLATGKIRNYQIIVGTISLLNLPVSLFFLYLGASATITYWVAIVLELFCLLSRLLMSRILTKLSVMKFIRCVIVNSLAVTVISSIAPIFLSIFVSPTFVNLIVVVVVSILSTLLTIYFAGLNASEKNIVNKRVKKLIIRS